MFVLYLKVPIFEYRAGAGVKVGTRAELHEIRKNKTKSEAGAEIK